MNESELNNIESYRKILGDDYNDISDADVLILCNRIKGFCHAIINKKLKDFSDKRKNTLLSFHSENNEQ
jgi:hypothetical protein